MSVFLIYFEKNNPNGDWNGFNTKYESLTDAFKKVNAPASQLKIEQIEIIVDHKKIKSYLIHDGVSSDKVLQSKLKDVVKEKQKKTIINFLDARLKNKSIECYFIFHLFETTIYKTETINYSSLQEIKLDDLNDFAEKIKREVLYRLVV